MKKIASQFLVLPVVALLVVLGASGARADGGIALLSPAERSQLSLDPSYERHGMTRGGAVTVLTIGTAALAGGATLIGLAIRDKLRADSCAKEEPRSGICTDRYDYGAPSKRELVIGSVLTMVSTVAVAFGWRDVRRARRVDVGVGADRSSMAIYLRGRL